MNSDFDVVCILIKHGDQLEHDGIRIQEWNPLPDAICKVGDALVSIIERGIYFIFLGVPKLGKSHADRQSNRLQWCRHAEQALQEHLRRNGIPDNLLVKGPEGVAPHELGSIAAD